VEYTAAADDNIYVVMQVCLRYRGAGRAALRTVGTVL
jgi:hypothetical protein